MARRSSDKKVLVLTVDRDDDLGRKAGIRGPILGREDNLKAAQRFILKDPTDSDANAMFKTIQVYDSVRRNSKAQIATLIGDENVGIVSDKKIMEQLEYVLDHFTADEVIFISDGAEDEKLVPLIATKVKTVYTERLIVRQHSQLESAYYMIHDFAYEILSDPKTSRIFVGLPAFALLLFALFGLAATRLVVGGIGLYLLVKGFHLEPLMTKAYKEVVSSMQTRKFSFFLYAVATAFFITALVNGYIEIRNSPATTGVNIARFVHSAVFLIFLGAASLIGALLMGSKHSFFRYMTYAMLSFAIAIVIYKLTEVMITPAVGYGQVILAVLFGGIFFSVTYMIELKYSRKKE